MPACSTTRFLSCVGFRRPAPGRRQMLVCSPACCSRPCTDLCCSSGVVDPYPRWGYETLDEYRAELAEFLGCKKDELALMHNATATWRS